MIKSRTYPENTSLIKLIRAFLINRTICEKLLLRLTRTFSPKYQRKFLLLAELNTFKSCEYLWSIPRYHICKQIPDTSILHYTHFSNGNWRPFRCHGDKFQNKWELTVTYLIKLLLLQNDNVLSTLNARGSHPMAELHILGQIQGASNFQDKSSLCCRYSLQHGPNWTIISGCPEGQTVVAKPDFDKSIIWSQPLDIHFITRGIQGWPKLILQVNCFDVVGRSWAVGYGCCNIPSVPGLHSLQVPCWIPVATTLTDRLRQYFLGGSHQLMQSDIVSLGADRYKLKTQSTGIIKVQIDIILRNFCQFGVEYK